jgi:hypothetical protein
LTLLADAAVVAVPSEPASPKLSPASTWPPFCSIVCAASSGWFDPSTVRIALFGASRAVAAARRYADPSAVESLIVKRMRGRVRALPVGKRGDQRTPFIRFVASRARIVVHPVSSITQVL